MVVHLVAATILLTNLLLRPVVASEISSPTLFELTNQVRKKHNLPSLNYSASLEQAANTKAGDMIANDYFDHFSPDGVTPWQFMEQIGYAYQFGGENLAIGFEASPEVVEAWLTSPTHRQNLLDTQFEDIGIATVPVTIDGVPDVVVVQMFGAELDEGVGNETLAEYVNSLLGVEDVVAE